MRYPEIAVPTEGDGSTFALNGFGYYRGHRLAEVHFRVLAGLIDLGVFFLPWLGLDLLRLLVTGDTNPALLVGLLVILPPAALSFCNVVVMQARTGQSLGKLTFGMVLGCPQVDPMNVAVNFIAAPTPLLLVLRWGFHGFDAVLLLGVWLVAFSTRRESLADRVCNTMVFRPQPNDDLTLHANMIGARDR